MQIYEVTLPSEYIGGLAKKAGSGIMQAGSTVGTGLAQAGQKAASAVANSTVAKDLGKIGSAVASKNVGRGLISGLAGVDIPQSQASIDADAAAAAEKLRAQGYGQPAKEISVQDAVKGVQQNTAQQQYIKGLVAQWQQLATKASMTKESKHRSKNKAGRTKSNWRQDALKSVGAAFDPPPVPRPAPGQMPAAVASSKQGKKMIQAYGQPKGGIQRTDEADKEYKTPAGVIVPGATKTDTATPQSSLPVAGNEYRDNFLKWAKENLKTSIPRVGTITLDLIYTTDVKDELDRALTQVVATAGDQQKNAIAVNNFLTYAVAGIARAAKKLKQNAGIGGGAGAVATSQGGGAIVTQQEIRNQLSSFTSKQLDTLKQLAQDPASRKAFLKSFGVQA